MEYVLEEGCVKILITTHDDPLLEGRTEKMCIMYITYKYIFYLHI